MNGTQFVYGMTTIASAIDENLVKTISKHQLMFGGRLRHERIGSRTDQAQDNIQFNGDATGLYNPSTSATNSPYANTGQLNADFFIGGAASYAVNQEPPYLHMHTWKFDAYLQDNYHVAHNLTLNLGVRYEAHPAIWIKGGLANGFDLKNDAMVLGAPISTLISEGYTTQAAITNDEFDGAKFETASQAGLPASLINNDNTVFEPRFGFAWQALPKWGTVVRSGYGIYAFQVPLRSAYKFLGGNNPFQLATARTLSPPHSSHLDQQRSTDLAAIDGSRRNLCNLRLHAGHGRKFDRRDQHKHHHCHPAGLCQHFCGFRLPGRSGHPIQLHH